MSTSTPHSDLIDKLGGNQPVAEFLGVLPSAVSNYRKTGFPAWTHLRLLRECEARGIETDPSLFETSKPPGRTAPQEAAQ